MKTQAQLSELADLLSQLPPRAREGGRRTAEPADGDLDEADECFEDRWELVTREAAKAFKEGLRA